MIVAELLARGQTLAVAESLTGGLLAAAFVDVPGVSRVFRGGLVVYATDLKATLAGVPATLAARGPVDPDVASALARGPGTLRGRLGLATTGVAGPDPQDGSAGHRLRGVAGPPHRRRLAGGSRTAIRTATVGCGAALLASWPCGDRSETQRRAHGRGSAAIARLEAG